MSRRKPALLVVDRGGLRHKSGRLVAAVITFMQVEFLLGSVCLLVKRVRYVGYGLLTLLPLGVFLLLAL